MGRKRTGRIQKFKSVSLPQEISDKIDALAKDIGSSRAKVIITAIKTFMADEVTGRDTT